MKVLLLADVKNLGKKGDVVEAAEGYARNFLIAKKLATPATNANIHQSEQQKSTLAHRAKQEKDEATVLASQIAKVELTMFVRLGENGKLFGAITSKDVTEELLKQTGMEIDRRKISLVEPVKGVGIYKAVAKLHPGISAEFTVFVKAAE